MKQLRIIGSFTSDSFTLNDANVEQENRAGADETAPPKKTTVQRALMSVLIGVILAIIGLAAFLLFFQRKMIYFPIRYEREYHLSLPSGAKTITFETQDGKQSAFFVPAEKDGQSTRPLWVMFAGNASTALDWLDFVEEQKQDADFLLVDYPGYGACDGAPSRESINRSCSTVLSELARQTNTSISDLQNRLHLVGYSIGGAVALDFASVHKPRKIILLAPFTSLHAMAVRSVGWPLSHLLLDRFDNEAALRSLAGEAAPPEIIVFHGDRDEIVPYSMSQELKRQFPDLIELRTVPGGTHNDLLFLGDKQIREAMAAD